MFARESTACLDLHQQALVDQEVGKIVPEHRSIFVHYSQWMLGDRIHPGTVQAVNETSFVDFLEVAVAEKPMQGIRGFAHLIAEWEDGVVGFHR
jgi:hypothetical protein